MLGPENTLEEQLLSEVESRDLEVPAIDPSPYGDRTFLIELERAVFDPDDDGEES